MLGSAPSGSRSAIRWPRTRKALIICMMAACLAISAWRAPVMPGSSGWRSVFPVHRQVGHVEVLENLFVEAVVAVEQVLQFAQERARFRALNDAVVVGAAQRHHLADAEDGAGFGGGAAIFGGIIDGAGGDDGALAGHEARVGRHGADGAGIGERNGGALEIGGGQLAVAGARHQVVEGVEIFLEIERAGVLDIGHHQAARAIFAGDVDGDPEIDLRVDHAVGLAVAFGVGVIERGDFLQRLDDGPSDDVGEGDFAAGKQGAVMVDDAAIFVHHLDGDGALRGGQRNGEAGGHVLGDLPGRAAQWLETLKIGRRKIGSRRRGCRFDGDSVGLFEELCSSFRPPWSGHADIDDKARLRASC